MARCPSACAARPPTNWGQTVFGAEWVEEPVRPQAYTGGSSGSEFVEIGIPGAWRAAATLKESVDEGQVRRRDHEIVHRQIWGLAGAGVKIDPGRYQHLNR